MALSSACCHSASHIRIRNRVGGVITGVIVTLEGLVVLAAIFLGGSEIGTSGNDQSDQGDGARL